jgi:hypothetical protein
MTHRSFAFVLALSVTVTPVISVVCEMDCAHPRPASTPCHEGHSAVATTLHDGTHACDHDHNGVKPALLTSGNGRGPFDSWVGASPTTHAADALFSASRPAAAIHSPPGFSSRHTPSQITVLRI